MALQDLTPQLRTRLRRVERIVGLFVLLAALVLAAGFAYYLYHTAARKGWFVPKCPYYTFVMSGEGLKVGDPVVLMGFTVGEITLIEAMPPGSWYKVYVGFEIRRPYYGYIWGDSKVKITTTGLLGSRRLEVTPGFASTPTAYEKNNRVSEILVDGKRVPLAEQPKGVFILPEEDPALTERAQKLLTTVEQALPNILGLTNQVYTVLTNSAQLTARLDALVADTYPVLTNLVVQLSATVDNANTNLTVLAASLNETLLNLAAITSNLNSQVQSNDQILSEISRLVVDADNLVQGLKRHWLLRGVFKKSAATNAPPAKVQSPPPAR